MSSLNSNPTPNVSAMSCTYFQLDLPKYNHFCCMLSRKKKKERKQHAVVQTLTPSPVKIADEASVLEARFFFSKSGFGHLTDLPDIFSVI